MLFRMAILTMLLATNTTGPARGDEAGPASGKAIVVDSDTLSVAGRTFRLDGIDGFEFHQFCFIDGQPWACGPAAVRSLQALVDPVDVTCTPTHEHDGEVARGQCLVGGMDIAEILVGDGWALARDEGRYADSEAAAKQAQRGAWQGTFVEPWTYRADLADIEARYLAEAPEMLRRAAEQGLTEGAGGISVFQGFEIVTVPLNDQMTHRRDRLADLAPGFIEAAIPEREVFDWGSVVQDLEGLAGRRDVRLPGGSHPCDLGGPSGATGSRCQGV